MVTVNVRDDGTIDGYITVSEWANKNNITVSGARYYIQSKRLKSIKVGKITYVKDDEPEWNDVGDGLLQNKRYSAVFKDKDGTAYNVEGKAFTDDGEVWYTFKDSRVNVTFPYVVPDKPEYVYRNKESEEEKSCSNCKSWLLDRNDENRRCSYCFDQDEWETESEE